MFTFQKVTSSAKCFSLIPQSKIGVMLSNFCWLVTGIQLCNKCIVFEIISMIWNLQAVIFQRNNKFWCSKSRISKPSRWPDYKTTNFTSFGIYLVFLQTCTVFIHQGGPHLTFVANFSGYSFSHVFKHAEFNGAHQKIILFLFRGRRKSLKMAVFRFLA